MRTPRRLSLALLGVAAVALMGTGGERESAHMHVVIGGTPAERTAALAAHIAGEMSGRYDGPSFGVPQIAAGGAGPVQVVSVGAADGGGPAVLSSGGGVDFTAPTPPWLAALASARPVSVARRMSVATADVPASDPPPRPV